MASAAAVTRRFTSVDQEMVYDVANHLSQLRSCAVKGPRNFSCLTAPGDFNARATTQTVFPWRLYPRLGSRRRRLTVVGTAHRIPACFQTERTPAEPPRRFSDEKSLRKPRLSFQFRCAMRSEPRDTTCAVAASALTSGGPASEMGSQFELVDLRGPSAPRKNAAAGADEPEC